MHAELTETQTHTLTRRHTYAHARTYTRYARTEAPKHTPTSYCMFSSESIYEYIFLGCPLCSQTSYARIRNPLPAVDSVGISAVSHQQDYGSSSTKSGLIISYIMCIHVCSMHACVCVHTLADTHWFYAVDTSYLPVTQIVLLILYTFRLTYTCRISVVSPSITHSVYI